LAFLFHQLFGGLYSIVMAFAVGEFVALIIGVAIVRRALHLHKGMGIARPCLLGVFCVALLSLGYLFGASGWLAFAVVAVAAIGIFSWAVMRERQVLGEGLEFLRRTTPRPPSERGA
jgi:hypothetical protein